MCIIIIKQFRYCKHGERTIDKACPQYFTYCSVYATPYMLVHIIPESKTDVDNKIARVSMSSAVSVCLLQRFPPLTTLKADALRALGRYSFSMEASAM